MKMRRARNRKALSLHYAAPSQHAGCLLILIGTTNNLVTSAILPIKARGMTLAGPGGRAKWPGQVGGCGNLIVLRFQPLHCLGVPVWWQAPAGMGVRRYGIASPMLIFYGKVQSAASSPTYVIAGHA